MNNADRTPALFHIASKQQLIVELMAFLYRECYHITMNNNASSKLNTPEAIHLGATNSDFRNRYLTIKAITAVMFSVIFNHKIPFDGRRLMGSEITSIF